MKISRLTIQGFKSFADRTVLRFDHAISGVVGPNGCGKSNVVDAIRWVMGEQNPRKLRGSQMHDIIFNGSEERGPLGMAEVTLTFANDGKDVPPEYAHLTEIEVTRRLLRSGDSEYLINRNQVRLRDVADLFLGSGAGAKAYAIVEQDRVGLLVNARAEERRRVIEEAAGITKYKSRKASAERKLTATEHNLARISDIVQEVGRRLNSLRRQARKAERYKKLRNEIELLELHDMTMRYFELMGLLKVDREHCTQLTDSSDRIEVDLLRLESDIEAARLALLDDERRLNATQARLYELESQVHLSEQEIAHSEADRERLLNQVQEGELERRVLVQDLQRLAVQCNLLSEQTVTIQGESGGVEGRISDLAAEVEQLSRHKLDLEQQEATLRSGLLEQKTREAQLRVAHQNALDRNAELAERIRQQQIECEQTLADKQQVSAALVGHQAELQGSREHRQDLEREVEAADARLRIARENLQQAESRLRESKDRSLELQSRLNSLRELEESHAAAPEGVQQALALAGSMQLPGIGGLVAGTMLVPRDMEVATAAVLGPRLQAILVDDLGATSSLLEAMQEHGCGRVHLVNRQDVTPARDPGIELPNGVKVLADLLTWNDGCQALGYRLLNGALLVEDAAQALALRSLGCQAPMVTVTGDLLDGDGTLSAGKTDATAASLLRQHREISELEAGQEALQRELFEDQQQVDELQRVAMASRDHLDGLHHDLQELALQTVKQEQDLRALSDQQSRLQADSDRIAARTQQNQEQRRENTMVTADLAIKINETASLIARSELEMGAHGAEVQRQEQRLSELIEALTEVRVLAASSRERRESVERQLSESQAASAEAKRRLERIDQAIDRDQTEAIKRAAAVEAARDTLITAASDATRTRDGLDLDRGNYDELVQRVQEMESTARSTRNLLTNQRDELSTYRLQLREHEVALQHLQERSQERYQRGIETVLYDFHSMPLPGPKSEDRREKIQQIIDSMGEINLAAATEYAELSERHEFLHRQQEDLVHAVHQLRRAITKIDRTTRKRFREAFEAIDSKFQQVFPRLFGGGQAHLKLVDPEDVLSSGVEIFAQPPGKRLQAISLMSGGEKALTAISLLFSVFLIKPAPFCLLDEVDAWLDDANVERFTELLRDISKLSQFIFISHNRATMEIADRLYGVTMEKPGISKLVSVHLAGESPLNSVAA